MRLVLSLFVIVGLLALAWATQGYLGAYWEVRELANPRGGQQSAEDALLVKGTSALPALREGLKARDVGAQMRAAKVLMEMGEDDGEEFLLALLKKHAEPDDTIGKQAETNLLEALDARDGPDERMRARLREAESKPALLHAALPMYNECLNKYRNWADGYARRARLLHQNGEAYEARRDCIKALLLAPNHYEARVTLGRVELALDAPYLAYKSFEHALLINPRLKPLIKKDIDDANRALDRENERRREEKRKRTPVA